MQMELAPRGKLSRVKDIFRDKKSDYDKHFPPLRMMKTSTPTTKNNSKDDSSSKIIKI